MSLQKLVVFGFLIAGAGTSVRAEQNAVGRTLPGIWVMPQGGVVSSTPGFTVTVMPVGYIGSISGDRQVVINGNLVSNVSTSLSENLIIPQYVYKTEFRKLSFSSSFYLPINWISTSGSIQLNNFARGRQDISGGLADVFFSPITLGIHFSETNNLAIDTKIFAPTGAFTPGNLSNLGMNEWTFQPNLTWTYMWAKRGLEIDNNVGLDIYSENPTNKYTSGTMFHWDGMLVQYLSKRAGIGAIVSNLTQINNDRGPLAGRLNGFRGRAWGAGPMFLYVIKPGKPGVTFQFRWVPEFAVTNLVKGNTLLVGFTFQI